MSKTQNKKIKTSSTNSPEQLSIPSTNYNQNLWKALGKAVSASHGGRNTKGKRKIRRPLATGKWTHLVLKSDKAKGSYNFLHSKHRSFIQKLIRSKARYFGIKIGDQVNMGNHLHLKIKFSSRKNFQNFLRSLTTMIARKITGARRGHKFGRFWQGLAFTRILKNSLEQLQLKGYFEANRRQRDIGPQARETYLEEFNRWIFKLRRSSA